MPFTAEEFHDLVRLVEAHPEWRAELRRLVLTDEMLSLPEQITALRARSEQQFQALIEAQQHTEARLDALTVQVSALAEAQQRTEARLDALTVQVSALAEAQQRTEARLDALTEAQQRTEARLDALIVQLSALAEAQQRTEARLDALTEAQQRTEARLDALTEAQQRTEARLDALAEAQQHTEARLDALIVQVSALTEAQQRTEARLDALAEAQQHTEARLDALIVQVSALTEAQQRTEARLDALAEAQQHTEARLDALIVQVTALTHAVQGLTDDVGELKGINLEMNYRFKGPAYFGRIMRRSHVLTSDEVTTLIEDARDRGLLSDADAADLYEADLIVRGRRVEDSSEIYLVVEVSWGVGPHDVERAAQRASLLTLTGVNALPVVAGQRVTAEARRLAHQYQMWQLADGQAIPPEAGEA